MDNKLRNIYKDIMKNKNLDKSIPQYFNNMADTYYTYAGVRLAMHYVTLYETYGEQIDAIDENTKGIINEINSIMHDYVKNKLKGQQLEEAIGNINRLRNKVINRIKVVATYTDIFQIFEYILNRVEYQFKNEENDDSIDDDFAREILQYIFDTQDNVIINGKIQDIIGQLPIRMTRQKYFELVKDSLSVYLGAEKSSFDNYLYLFRSSAMIYSLDNMKDYYPELWSKKVLLERLNYKEITEDAFQEADNMLRDITLFLENETSLYFGIQEVINELYAMLLCSPYVGLGFSSLQEVASPLDVSKLILEDINREFINNSIKDISSKTEDNLMQLEGVQEELINDLPLLEDVLYSIDNSNRELTKTLMIENVLNVLLRTKALLSSSLFIDFDIEDVSGTVDEEMFSKEKNKLIDDLTELFASHDRVIMRSVMASTLSKMPVFFNGYKEVMDYVRNSLENCTNSKEKQACKKLIRDIMLSE